MKTEKLYPEYKNYIWGGERLVTSLGKRTAIRPVAESWELSFHKDGLTRLANGETLKDAAKREDLGENAADMDIFPVLIKFIDAARDLSVQVHPSDSYALKNESSLGKTEMWYIVEADEGAGIYLGLKETVSPEQLASAIEEERLTELLNFIPVKSGECYFIPAGTVHAICRGCLIAEIQQNSNITYRVYDWGRRDKDGNPRPLHIENARAVADLNKFSQRKFPEGYLGISRYFTVRELSLSGELEHPTDKGSFVCLTAVSGEGSVDGVPFSAGDSIFVPAGEGAIKIIGKGKLLMTSIRKYYVGIDLGGTFIKGGIVDDLGNIITEAKVPTGAEGGSDAVAENIASLVSELIRSSGLESSDLEGIGMGVPGMIDSKKGEVVYSNNLGWEHFMISDKVEALTGLRVKIANDANVAALGEARFGCGKDYKTTVFLTLGTGVGGGIVIDGKLYEGNRSAGAEMGHSVIVAGGERCTCGRRGCLEAYASATALIRDTKRAMEAHPESELWKIGSIENVNGKTAFDYKDTDPTARAVVDNYLEMLTVGIANIANELRPEAVILGGGVCAQGKALTEPLTRLLAREIYGADRGPKVEILIATLGNSAGLLGAAALLME